MRKAVVGLVCMAILWGLVSQSGVAVDLQKPSVYKGDEDIIGWMMSEKLDGIRGYWDGVRLLTRKGIPINAPEWFLENFPAFELDGELWCDRQRFEFVQSTVMDDNPGDGWKNIRYMIFEVPNVSGDFFMRLAKAKAWFESNPNSYVRIIPQITCQDRDHLNRYLNEIETIGGEGLVIKDPTLAYEAGRSTSILKVKKYRDMEGVVIAINPGKGKFENMMGSLTLELDNGVRFRLGTGFTKSVRMVPPVVGSVVTFKYYGFTKTGIPKFASFLRRRKD